jgi:hypothetical protein
MEMRKKVYSLLSTLGQVAIALFSVRMVGKPEIDPFGPDWRYIAFSLLIPAEAPAAAKLGFGFSASSSSFGS